MAAAVQRRAIEARSPSLHVAADATHGAHDILHDVGACERAAQGKQRRSSMQPTPQDDQLMSKHRVLGFKPQLRLEWRGQDGQNETEQPDHSANLGVSITASTRKRFSVHTASMSSRADCYSNA